jgi:hypothetical protein
MSESPRRWPTAFGSRKDEIKVGFEREHDFVINRAIVQVGEKIRVEIVSPDSSFCLRVMRGLGWFILSLLLSIGVLPGALDLAAAAQNEAPVHGLWVWKGPSIVAEPRGVEKLREFCQSEGINEVYISVSSHGTVLAGDFPRLIDLLHRNGVRIEALLSSENADEPGEHRGKLLHEAEEVVRFNQNHPKSRFDGIHLDIEPQQRPENKGPGNLRFLPGLAEVYRAVRQVAEPAQLKVNADIQNKLLKGDLAQRRLLLSSLPRLTLMLYEVGSHDGESIQQKTDKLRTASQKFLDMAYAGLHDTDLAEMVIGLRTSDYGELLPQMLLSLDSANRTNQHYVGWARHSYNDFLQGSQ